MPWIGGFLEVSPASHLLVLFLFQLVEPTEHDVDLGCGGLVAGPHNRTPDLGRLLAAASGILAENGERL